MEIIQLYIFLSMEINFQEIDHRALVKLWLRNTTTKFDISVFFPLLSNFKPLFKLEKIGRTSSITIRNYIARCE